MSIERSLHITPLASCGYLHCRFIRNIYMCLLDDSSRVRIYNYRKDDFGATNLVMFKIGLDQAKRSFRPLFPDLEINGRSSELLGMLAQIVSSREDGCLLFCDDRGSLQSLE